MRSPKLFSPALSHVQKLVDGRIPSQNGFAMYRGRGIGEELGSVSAPEMKRLRAFGVKVTLITDF